MVRLNAARLALPVLLVLRCCLALRRSDPLDRVAHPEWVARLDGPQVVPRGRHIQYLFYNLPHGLSDRMAEHFRFLVALGLYHNATVHIQGGSEQAMNWLDKRHTHEIAEDWGRYFDTHANGGSPWHPLENFHPCKSVVGGENLSQLFADGSRCVNIYDHIRGFKGIQDFLPRSDHDKLLPVSNHIKGAAHDFMVRYRVPESYGSIHIRRCDRGKANCTAPQHIYDAVLQNPGPSTWIVFLYAEPGYAEQLHERLRPLKKRFLFEGEAEFNRAFPLDNYFTYLLGRYLNTKAATIVETHLCKGGSPLIRKGVDLTGGIFLGREAEALSKEDSEGTEGFHAEEHLSAVCTTAERGATLKKDPVKDTFGRGIPGREHAHSRVGETKVDHPPHVHLPHKDLMKRKSPHAL